MRFLLSQPTKRSTKKRKSIPVSKKPEAETKKRSKPPSVVRIITEAIVAQELTPRDNWFRPSMLFGCDRNNLYHYNNQSPDPPMMGIRLHLVCENGDHVHQIVQHYLGEHYKVWFAHESRVRLRILGGQIKGSCDGVLVLRKSGYRWGIEIKSINHDEFMMLAKPKRDHVEQAMVYGYIQNLDWMTILYWDKDKQFLKEFHVKVRKKRARAKLEARMQHLMGYVKSDTLPPFKKSTCNRTFCRYVRQCKRDGGDP